MFEGVQQHRAPAARHARPTKTAAAAAPKKAAAAAAPKKAAAGLDADASARAAMQQAIAPQGTSACRGCGGAGARRGTVLCLGRARRGRALCWLSYTDAYVRTANPKQLPKAAPAKPAAAAAAAAAAKSPPAGDGADGGDAQKSLQRQWADAFGVDVSSPQTPKALAARTRLVTLPKGMAAVKRDGKMLGGAVVGGDGDASAQSTFHARAAAAILEAYLGKHGGTESHALTLIAVGAAATLAALVTLVVSVCVCVQISMYTCIHMYKYMCMPMHVFMYKNMHV